MNIGRLSEKKIVVCALSHIYEGLGLLGGRFGRPVRESNPVTAMKETQFESKKLRGMDRTYSACKTH